MPSAKKVYSEQTGLQKKYIVLINVDLLNVIFVLVMLWFLDSVE